MDYETPSAMATYSPPVQMDSDNFTPGYEWNPLGLRHKGSVNILFFDGHVKWMKYKEIQYQGGNIADIFITYK